MRPGVTPATASFKSTRHVLMSPEASNRATGGGEMKSMAWRLGMWLLAASLVEPRAVAEVLTPKHVAKIRTVTAAEISPDGSRVAYVLSVPRRPIEDEDG